MNSHDLEQLSNLIVNIFQTEWNVKNWNSGW